MSASAPYLGKPGAMQALFLPGRGRTSDPSRGEATHTLSGGGTAVTRRLNAKRSFSMTWSYLPEYAADQLRGFYLGLFDDPTSLDFVFVDSTVRNVLGLDASATGQRSQAGVDWFATGGAVAVSTAVTSPVLGAGVLAWTGAANSQSVQPGQASTANPATAPVYLPAEPLTASVWVQADAAYSVRLQLQGYSTSGALAGSALSSTFTTSTSWQRLTYTVAAGVAGLSGAAFVRPRIATAASGGVPSTLYFSGAQLEYANAASTWQPGFGSPRVVIPSTIGRSVQVIGFSDHTLTLSER